MYSARIYICLFFSLTPFCVSQSTEPTETAEPECNKGKNQEEDFVTDYTKSVAEIREMEKKLKSPEIDYLCQRALGTDNSDGITSDKDSIGEQKIKGQYSEGGVTVFPVSCRNPEGMIAYFCLSSITNRIYTLEYIESEYKFGETICVNPVLD